ncbi:MAG: TraR/DksA C4-type zinc finger protein [Leptospiraceae bacterium]|nr:TraR/DksA C4-type zinc finger protein [Leptospiraceae bacterium]
MDTTIARKTLEDMRNRLTARVGRIEAHIRRDGKPLDQDSEEALSERTDDAVLDGLDVQERKELQDIDHALSRIAQGQYHVCSKCGSTIGAERLTALPYTTVCVHCG